MAKRSFSIGYGIAFGLTLFGVGPIVMLLWAAGGIGALGEADWIALRFTILQALLSTFFSVLLAVFVARALARRVFWGRSFLVLLMGAPFILPVIVAVLGLITVFGRSGWFSVVLSQFGLPPLSIYGLHGVVIAHVFFNLPLAARLVLNGWSSIPQEHIRLAASLNFGSGAFFHQIERPMLARVLPGTAAIIFLICTTSFAVALLLGGGPKATTLELAIYQAFRFEFDLSHATALALLQAGVGLLAAIAAYVLRAPIHVDDGMDIRVPLHARRGRWLDGPVLILASLFLILPLGAILTSGLAGLSAIPAGIWPAIGRSLVVALCATLLTLALALPIANMIANNQRSALYVDGMTLLLLAISPLVFGTGIFLAMYRWANPVDFALPVTAISNAMVALPFAVQAILPPMRQAEERFGMLSAHLRIEGLTKWRIILIPRLIRPIGFAAGLTAALSMGDLGVVALFSDPAKPTLPLYVHQLMGSYRTQAAEGAALILIVASLLLFWTFDRGARLHARD